MSDAAARELEQSIGDAIRIVSQSEESEPTVASLRELALRARKLVTSWDEPACLGFFGPSQAGKSFLVGALLSHELRAPAVQCRGKSLDFLKEINPAKGVESTGVVTRFSTRGRGGPVRLDFQSALLSLESLIESMATGFLDECTATTIDAEQIERAIREARLQ